MKKALIVGINDYKNAPLRGCIRDAELVNELLSTDADGSPNFDTKIMLDVKTRAALKTAIRDLLSGDPSLALFYFSGHGFSKDGKSYIVTPDFSKEEYGVDMQFILELVKESKAKNKVVIIDSCFSGAFGEISFIENDYSLIPKGTTILTASRPDEPSYEVNGHGVFTNLFLEALRGGAADITGNISPGSVYSFIDKSLGSWGQRPIFKTNVSESISLRTIEPAVEISELRELTHLFGNPYDEFALNPSFEFTNSPTHKHELLKPYAIVENTTRFKVLQKFTSIGLVEPVGEDHMYFAAMNSKSCKLTALGHHYWKLVKEKRI